MRLIRLPSIAAAFALTWSPGGFAASDEEWLERMQVQENLLEELQSARGPTDLSLVEPLQAMIVLLRERSEYGRVAELQEHQLERFPDSDHVFWNEASSYYEAELDISINSVGFVQHVDVLEFEPENNEVRYRLRRAAEDLRFRPIMEDNRRRRMHDVHIRVLIPRGADPI